MSKSTKLAKTSSKTKAKSKKGTKVTKTTKPSKGNIADNATKPKKKRTLKVRTNKKTANRSGDWKLHDLKGAEYNPRLITDKRLDNMGDSYEQFGDLSGIVFNRRSGVLISGHQRIANVKKRGYESKIKTSPIKQDSHGTVEEGFMGVKTPKGVVRIPVRVVDWEDQKAEFAANIAANAHGGIFDYDKLARMNASLELEDFEIGVLGLDEETLKTMPKMDTPSKSKSSGSDDDEDEDGGEFEAYDGESFDDELKHECPKCGFNF